ncbi:hypothetical protein BJ878DRAFT_104254 [Calycina marina]|uniref:Postreplication repair E3 ubiquitin-protein ligase RAD18 n=1 Tax=Calycina marina TaxID=1763456 RepID=A0A9P8CEH3_9HELO|nr:hypothetical protein BJ878DRAFT_104254 [Calycina marina]
MDANLNTENVMDSTDWNDTALPAFEQVDAALRCRVCKDFYETPMITSCAHTFCSRCIRRCLTDKGICPVCNTKDQEMKLRPNLAIGELVDAFAKAWRSAFDLAKSATKGCSVASLGSGKRKRVVEAQTDEGPFKKTRASGRRTRSSTQQSVTIPDSDDDYTDEEPEDGLVSCPICQGRMSVQDVQKHIDKCDGLPPPRKKTPIPAIQHPVFPTRITKPPSKLTTLAHPHYGLLKDGPLRKKLTDQGLRADGSRALLEKRWTEFVIAYNANCDSIIPKSKLELKKHMEKWERAQTVHDREGAMIADKEFDGRAWAMKHDNGFKKLIEDAKRKLTAKDTQQQAEMGSPEQRNRDTMFNSTIKTTVAGSHSQHLQHPQSNMTQTQTTPRAPILKPYENGTLPAAAPPPNQYSDNLFPSTHTHSLKPSDTSQPPDEYDPPLPSQLQHTPTPTRPGSSQQGPCR